MQKTDRVGQVFGSGRYQIIRALDAGGMGAIFVAQDQTMGVEVVIKFPHEDLMHRPEIRKRFMHEVGLLIQLSRQHANIVTIQDVGEEHGTPFAVMQYLESGSLREWYQKTKNRGSVRSLRWLRDIADALDYVHSKDLIHRDVKPQNILFDVSGGAYLADFGISKPATHVQRTGPLAYEHTADGTVIGTLGYMAHEMLMGEPIDYMIDQHALAVTLYETLTGRRPFSGNNQYAVATAQKTRDYVPLHEAVVEITKPASEAVDRAMSMSPKDRFPTCSDFAETFISELRRQPAPEKPSQEDTSKIKGSGVDTDQIVIAEVIEPPPAPPKPRPQPQPVPANPVPTQKNPQPETPKQKPDNKPERQAEHGSGRVVFSNLTCPWCWNVFSPAELLWVAAHPDLRGDSQIPDEFKRFLPERFNASCQAIDPMGETCTIKACPSCHLEFPQALVDCRPLFISVLGTPSAGKSCFLAAMTWQARKLFSTKFKISFSDASLALNQRAIANEDLLFAQESDAHVRLKKTELQGDEFGYQTIQKGGREISYLSPYVYELRPKPSHPNYQHVEQASRALCIYDNAGEQFLPGQDRNDRPVTRHLVQSDALVFVYDPSQDQEFSRTCRDATTDAQFDTGFYPSTRQEMLLIEARNRLRHHGALSSNQKYQKPIVVLLNKYDAWAAKFGLKRLSPPWNQSDTKQRAVLDGKRLVSVGSQLRRLMSEIDPEFVAALDSFASKVIYLPLSSFGRRVDSADGVRAQSLNPMWAEVPLLYILSQTGTGLVQAK